MRTKIVVIPAHVMDARKICETIENMVVENEKELLSSIQDASGGGVLKDEFVQIYDMTDFMDRCNNMDFDLNSCFISYVNFKFD